MRADFCSDIKSLRYFLAADYNKLSVRVRWLQSEKKSDPHFDFFSELLTTKHGPCALGIT